MENSLAKKLGSFEAIKCLFIGLFIAYFIMIYLYMGNLEPRPFFWIFDFPYKLNLFIGISTLFVTSYLVGRQAGFEVIILKKNKYLTGIMTSFLSVITSILSSSIFGIIQNYKTGQDWALDYVEKPFVWIFLYGSLPMILLGIWLGHSLIKKSSQLTSIDLKNAVFYQKSEN